MVQDVGLNQAQMDFLRLLFHFKTEEEVREYEQRKADKGNKPPKPPRKPRTKPKFTWFKHIQSTISKAAGDIFDDMENEEI